MSVHSRSSEEAEELSALEYARTNGLARNPLEEPHPLSYLTTLSTWIDGDRPDDSHLPQFKFPNCSTDEYLEVSKEALDLIAEVSKPETPGSIDAILLSMLGRTDIKSMRFELPLLRSDHESDCKEFASRDDFEVKLQDIKLPLEVVDEAKGEGLTIPSKYWNQGVEIMEELKKEHLEVTRETIAYLGETLKVSWNDADEKEVWASVHDYKKTYALEPVTPPLSPMVFSSEPYEPSLDDPAFQLPILSDPVSLLKEDLNTIEKHIFDQDIPTPIRQAKANNNNTSSGTCSGEVIKIGDIYSPAASLDGPPRPPVIETRRGKREDLKVEETLTPPNPTPTAKFVHSSNLVEEILNDPGIIFDTKPFDESTFFEEAFGDAGEKAMRQVEQETLIEADATARVAVPVMDFSKPKPPWDIPQAHSPTPMLANFRGSMGLELPRWPNQKLINDKLRWNPFPHDLAKVAVVEEAFQDDEVWKGIMNAPGDDEIIDTSSLTWKPPGLRILKEDEGDDDEIEPASFAKQEPQDLFALAKKRKMEIEQNAIETGRSSVTDPDFESRAANASQVRKNPTPKPIDSLVKIQNGKSERPGGLGLLMGEAWSLGNALDNFLEIRGTKKLKLTDSSYFANPCKEIQPQEAPTPGSPLNTALQLPTRKSPIAKIDPLPTPSIDPPATPPKVIISSNLFKDRALIKRIQSHLLDIIFIERDFTAHNTTAWMPNSVTRSPIASPLDSEADLIVSASTGIILTTLQKIKQKPLPGQKTKPAVRERLEKVSARYEQLIVLVSEGGDGTTNGLNENDCQALSEFIGFTLGLSSTIIVHFVGGGEETLAKWLVSSIIHHSPVGEYDLLEDETHWELFLRRAGMNAFAAQVIAAALKAPDGIDPQSPTKSGLFGLTAFVEMGLEQRIARFGAACGRRLLERVSAVVDARWE